MKKLLVTTFATALLTGCGAQPAQESASKTPVKPGEPVTLTPAQPVPEVKPVEPVAKKTSRLNGKQQQGKIGTRQRVVTPN
jgi:type IV pilus biogenesis protein CpaD/CtpE